MKQIIIYSAKRMETRLLDDNVEYQVDTTDDGDDVKLGYYTDGVSEQYGILNIVTEVIGFIGKVNIKITKI